MRILFCIDSLKSGGAEKIMSNTVNELAKDESLEITVLTLTEDIEYSLHERITVKSFMKNGRIYRKMIKYLPAKLLYIIVFLSSRAMRAGKTGGNGQPKRMDNKGNKSSNNHILYDVEIAFMEGASTKVISGCLDPAIRKFAWVHTDMIKYPWSQRSYRSTAEEKKAYASYDKIFSVSTGTRQAFTEKVGMPATFIRNCINEIEVIYKAKEISISLYDSSFFNIVSVGSLKPIKGYERLIPVHLYLKNKGVKCKHYLLGDGPLREELQQSIDENGLHDIIILKGFNDNPYPWIAQADLLACVSYAEGYSSVVSEAAILKTPVLTTDCQGMDDILGNSEYGMIVYNDNDGIAIGLEKMISDNKVYQNYKDKIELRSREFRLEKQIRNLRDELDV